MCLFPVNHDITTCHTHIQHRTVRDERDSKESLWLTKVLQVFVAWSTSGDSTIVFRLRAFGYTLRPTIIV